MLSTFLMTFLKVPCRPYIDDFLVFSPSSMSAKHAQYTKKLLGVLGFDISSKADGCIEGSIGQNTEALGLNYKTEILPDGSPLIQVSCPDNKRLQIFNKIEETKSHAISNKRVPADSLMHL